MEKRKGTVPPRRPRPDYGLFLLQRGISSETPQVLPSVPLQNLKLINTDTLTTVCSARIGDAEFYLSLDFPTALFEDIVKLAPAKLQEELKAGAAQLSEHPHVIELSFPFFVGIRSRLGEMEQNQEVTFVPFLVDAVFKGEETKVGPGKIARYGRLRPGARRLSRPRSSRR